MMRRSVVLPHPDGPTSTMNSPSAISIDTRSTATTSLPNRFVTSWRTIRAMAPPQGTAPFRANLSATSDSRRRTPAPSATAS